MVSTPTDGGRQRRRRRTQTEVKQRIVDAAFDQFSQRGYAATTTRDIALQADVSETLLFRHFGSKAALFDHVAFDPFDALATRYLESAGAQDSAGLDRILSAFLAFLSEGQQLFTTLAVKGLEDTDDERAATRLDAMRRHYARAADWLRREHATAGTAPPVDAEIGVRLGFGMVLASSLFAEWLFPDGEPPREVIVDVIDRMLAGALGLPAPDRD